jgi:nucleotide-binding universal stress UspA family protein
VSSVQVESDLEEAKAHVQKAVEMARKEDVPVETLTPIGKPHEAIIEIAGGRGADLIVMGTHGKTGLKKLLMGSTTEKVIGRANCAVLVVKATRAAGRCGSGTAHG